LWVLGCFADAGRGAFPPECLVDRPDRRLVQAEALRELELAAYTARLSFDNADLPVYALEELAEVDVWGVVRFTIRWHVARAGQGR